MFVEQSDFCSDKLWEVREKSSSEILALKENKRPGLFAMLGVLSIPFLLTVAAFLRRWRWGCASINDVVPICIVAGVALLLIGYYLSYSVTIEADRRSSKVVAITKRFWRRTVKEATNPQRFGLVFAHTVHSSKGAIDFWWLAARTPKKVVKLALLSHPLASDAMSILNKFFGIKIKPYMTSDELCDVAIRPECETGGEEFDVLSRGPLLREKKRARVHSTIAWVIVLVGSLFFLFRCFH